MYLTYDQICALTHGAVRVVNQEGCVCFHRFTEEQQETYRKASPDDFYPKTFATSGIRLCFVTGSSFVRMNYRMKKASSRKFGWFDVYENRVLIAHFGVEIDGEVSGSYEITLSSGEKNVEIYFPWSAVAELRSLEVEDGAFVRPIKKERLMLSFGDSITQGYDAIYPSLSYISRLSDKLNASCVNKGIGGEKFFPELLDSAEDLQPDLITVAYGTNDWSRRDRQTYEDNCRRFYAKLTQRYPATRIFAITPIWRADDHKGTPFGAPLCEAVKLIESICSEFPNITVIHGGGFTPKLTEFYSDARLHPNDLGFGFYAENLYQALSKALAD